MSTSYVAFQDGINLPADTFKTWTVYSAFVGGSGEPIIDEDGNATPFFVEEDSFASFTSPLGASAVGTGSASWVDEAVVSNYARATSNGATNTYQLTGLNNTKTYTITVFGSLVDVGTQTTEYSVDGFTSQVDVDITTAGVANTTSVGVFSSVVPVAGKITLSVRDAGGMLGFLNAMSIEEDVSEPSGTIGETSFNSDALDTTSILTTVQSTGRAVIVATSIESSAKITSVTVGGVATTLIVECVEGNNSAALWFINDTDLPAGVGPHAVAKIGGVAGRTIYGVWALTGVSQSLPTVTAIAAGVTVDTVNADVTASDNDWVLAGSTDGAVRTNIWTADAVERWDLDVAGQTTGSGADKKNVSAGVVNMEVTSNLTSSRLCLAVVSLHVFVASTGGVNNPNDFICSIAGLTKLAVPDKWQEYLTGKGYPYGSFNDSQFKWLGTNGGYTGSLTDRTATWRKAGFPDL